MQFDAQLCQMVVRLAKSNGSRCSSGHSDHYAISTSCSRNCASNVISSKPPQLLRHVILFKKLDASLVQKSIHTFMVALGFVPYR